MYCNRWPRKGAWLQIMASLATGKKLSVDAESCISRNVAGLIENTPWYFFADIKKPAEAGLMIIFLQLALHYHLIADTGTVLAPRIQRVSIAEIAASKVIRIGYSFRVDRVAFIKTKQSLVSIGLFFF